MMGCIRRSLIREPGTRSSRGWRLRRSLDERQLRDEHSFLAGKLYDDRGNLMGPSYAAKGSRRWRYYVSRAALTGRGRDAGSIARVSAPEVEAIVIQAVTEHLARLDHSRCGAGASSHGGIGVDEGSASQLQTMPIDRCRDGERNRAGHARRAADRDRAKRRRRCRGPASPPRRSLVPALSVSTARHRSGDGRNPRATEARNARSGAGCLHRGVLGSPSMA